jgi:hypothetical protein
MNQKITLVPANAVNMTVAINNNIVYNYRQGNPGLLSLMGLVERAKLLHDESGTILVIEYPKKV